MQQAKKNWNLLGPLGEGGFGEVRHWKNVLTGQEIATKSLKQNPKLKPDEVEVLKIRWTKEYNWMKSLQTPYIVAAIDIDDNEFLQYLQEQNHWKMLPVIVMEYCDGGDLRTRLQRVDNTNGLTEKDVRDVLRTLRFAVEYLHKECNIEHRDIKPENIVIHTKANEKIYKLTDFGYAREIPENTVAQSVVGTRHYVAPEVIEPGCYTKTVDYWSVGVVAFEIICGFRPFIPHRQLRLILTNILRKPRKCIAITQCIDDPEDDRFIFEEKITRQNNCSPIFNAKIERWLALALDTDYKQRGSANNRLEFYSQLDAILETKIVSVYSITSASFFYFDIRMYSNIQMFLEVLSKDTKIPHQSMFLTLPTGHPMKSFANITNPSQFFVSEWMDQNNPDNPLAMLYVADFKQCDFNVHVNKIFGTLPKLINICLGRNPLNYEQLPLWFVEQFERHVHFLLSDQQRLVECHMRALFDYIIFVDHEACIFDSTINQVKESTIFLCGQVRQFVRTVELYSKTRGVENVELMAKSQEFSKDCDILNEGVTSNIVKRYKSLLSHCKALSKKEIYKSLPKADIFKLKSFRRYLMESDMSNSVRMKECLDAFDTWTRALTNFSRNEELRTIHKEISTQCDILYKTMSAASNFLTYVAKFEKQLDEATSGLLKTICDFGDNSLQLTMNALQINDIQSNIANGNSFDPSICQLIDNTHSLGSSWIAATYSLSDDVDFFGMQSLNTVMDVDGVMQVDDIPIPVQEM